MRDPPTFAEQIGARAARKLAGRSQSVHLGFGLGMMGVVGSSVTVPTLLGAALGSWLDKHHPGHHAWTLSLLMVGLTIGCLTAWHWVASEERDEPDDASGSDA